MEDEEEQMSFIEEPTTVSRSVDAHSNVNLFELHSNYPPGENKRSGGGGVEGRGWSGGRRPS